MKRIAINGMGRTGRVMLRRLTSSDRPPLDLVAVNDVADIEEISYLLKYDSVHGRLDVPVHCDGDFLIVGDRRVLVLCEPDPAKLPWGDHDIDAVIEATGRFTRREDAAAHLRAGARRVLVSAPSPDADVTIVLGVNETDFDAAKHRVISNASCTTNSLAPVLKVLNEKFGIERAVATTIHAYTASQSVVDKFAKKKHRGRAAAVSMIPTSTGADAATVQVLPQLAGRIRVIAVRVPVPNGSLTDISAHLSRTVSSAEVNAALADAARGPYKGIIGYAEDELVSVDIIGRRESGIVHAAATTTTGDLAKVLVWYDNEAGYAERCLDEIQRLAF
jgi:glyceraldehyde 3-phosphate dehydrogenase/glyceraldehyde-3-phosphate dehydrogenase (NAD(P))